MKRKWTISVLILGILAAVSSLQSRKEEQPKDAMLRQFPRADVVRESLYLSREDQARLNRKLGKRMVDSRLVSLYVARQGQQLLGVGMFDTHIVRTKSETLFIVFKPDGSVHSVELIAFNEPGEYRPPERWLGLISGKKPGVNFQELPAISGATLTVQAVKKASRKTHLLFDLYRQGKSL